MTQTAFQSNPVQLSGDLPQVGNKAPEFTLTGGDLAEVTNETFAGKKVVYNIFPSVDTGVCAASVRHFNEDAAGLDNTVVVNVSRDLPFALGRFCAAEGLDNVEVASDFRHGFGEAFGAVQQDGPLAGLLARAVVVTDEEGKVIYNQLVDEITTEPDYDSALAALK
ncbi:lipid hydroperoxide peroxidase [Corynebacterium sp. LK19]|uniref:thiol peroxidase n=1 Tax=unclassified Corynebacterium TaxID=2624378 RepID=UPI0011C7D0FC|nr:MULTISPECIES: thiol peroxidase [unclassified Corynebacterium]MBC6747215.1 lipid hydroperoxide peroxidase [Corynebacterium sp. LK25]TXS60397.1 lipid hydroperoxide peroxidase [Corynebacterium sp. LK19]TXS82375.1 lipid hydroperoxide peroxidase [Corynebacterium sp. LK10]